jgi:hypothetical protein
VGKKYFSILILTLLMIHLAGFYVYFVVRLGEVRMEMRKKLASLPDDRLEVVAVPKASFKASWLEEREMKWKGRMYDIARVEVGEKTILVFCLHDEDEDGLLSFLSSVAETSRQDRRDAPDSLVQFFSLKFVTSPVLISTPDPVLPVNLLTVYNAHTCSFDTDPDSPPPRS